MTDNLSKKAESKLSNPKAAMFGHGRFAVEASPFNGIKLELAIVLVIVALLCAIGSRLTQDGAEFFFWALSCTFLGALWIIVRTRLVVKKLMAQQKSESE